MIWKKQSSDNRFDWLYIARYCLEEKVVCEINLKDGRKVIGIITSIFDAPERYLRIFACFENIVGPTNEVVYSGYDIDLITEFRYLCPIIKGKKWTLIMLDGFKSIAPQKYPAIRIAVENKGGDEPYDPKNHPWVKWYSFNLSIKQKDGWLSCGSIPTYETSPDGWDESIMDFIDGWNSCKENHEDFLSFTDPEMDGDDEELEYKLIDFSDRNPTPE